MLFHSLVFLFCFLPVVFIIQRVALAAWGSGPAILFLGLASLVFYGWHDPMLLPMFVGSILANYGIGIAIRRWRGEGTGRVALAWLWVGVLLNLGLIAHFKYLGFLAETAGALLGVDFGVEKTGIPAGISFYTFLQIAYLVDHWKKPIPDASLSRYTLFVSFFPHLIAGPIIHHRDVMPQFDTPLFRRPPFAMVASGLVLLAVGLFKKMAVADNLAPVATALFDAAGDGDRLRALETWVGVLAYSLQIYFDFSGYSDMAIGLGRLFGIRFPVNFWSPYQATSIIDFWRRWHITLSHFLRDYLYIPLGGNRFGKIARYRNLVVTMLLGGLWHGANWTFVLWGAIHGALLALNHLWLDLRPKSWPEPGVASRLFGRLSTYLLVSLAWVFFRAETPEVALSILGSLFGAEGDGFPSKPGWAAWLKEAEIEPFQAAMLFGGMLLAQCAPNSARLILGYRADAEGRIDQSGVFGPGRFRFRPTLPWALAAGLLFFAAFWFAPEVSEFIYFQF